MKTKVARLFMAALAGAALLTGCGRPAPTPAPGVPSAQPSTPVTPIPSPVPVPAPTTPTPSAPSTGPAPAPAPANPQGQAAADVVKQYYAFVAQGKMEQAWGLVHPSDRIDPRTGEEDATKKAAFLAQKPGPRLVEAAGGPTLGEYKFYSTQLRLTNVATVNVAFAGGAKQTLHLAADEAGQWRVFWVQGPEPGLE